MRLARGQRQGAVIPMTPLVDVMLILLVFFMVTSTYLDLDMIPADGPSDEAAAAAPAAAGRSATMLIRLDAGDRVVWRGQGMTPAALGPLIRDAVAARPALRLLILPSPRASTQTLVAVLEAVERAGAAEARVLRVEEEP